MGKWIRRQHDEPKIEPHTHDYPRYDIDGTITEGDIWKCSCFSYFQCGRLSRKTDRDGLEWRAMWPEETKG